MKSPHARRIRRADGRADGRARRTFCRSEGTVPHGYIEVKRSATAGRKADRFVPQGALQGTWLIVTVGLRASPLAEQLPVKRDELGRLPTDEMLRVKEVPGVYATGDIARAYVDDENLALMSCQHAEVMGRFAGYNAARDLLGLSLRSYRQPDYLTCLDLGVSGALFTAGWDREVQKEGEEAKQLKQLINCEWIYPPKGDRDAILAAAHIDARPYLEYGSKISATS